MKWADDQPTEEECFHENYVDPDPHGYSICLDCSTLLFAPVFYIYLPEWFENLWKLDADPGDCTDN